MTTADTKLEKELIDLEEINQKLIRTAEKSIGTYGLFTFDLYCTAIINRTLNLNKGFSTQIRDNNFISAAPLVRISLDSLLRLFAAFQVDYNIDTFASDIIKGQAINKTKDKEGKQMKDFYLVELLSKKRGYSWVKKIYDAGNEYVHFTSQHVFACVKIEDVNESSTIKGVIQNKDHYIDPNEKIWATKAMIQITKGIIYILNFWIRYKQTL